MSHKARDEFERTTEEHREKQRRNQAPDEQMAAEGEAFCCVENDGYECTRAKGHTGQHVAHGVLGHIYHKWSAE